MFPLQVMNVDLLDGDKVTFEDSGGGDHGRHGYHGDRGVLANESVLMRGLVVRSRSNQIRLRLRSRRPQPGSMLLRYQGEGGVNGHFLWAGQPHLHLPCCFEVGFYPIRNRSAANGDASWRGLALAPWGGFLGRLHGNR